MRPLRCEAIDLTIILPSGHFSQSVAAGILLPMEVRLWARPAPPLSRAPLFLTVLFCPIRKSRPRRAGSAKMAARSAIASENGALGAERNAMRE